MRIEERELGRMDRKKIEMRNKIVDTAIRLIHSNGYEATTMEQIAKETDIAKGTLYNYYPVKEAIISDFIKQSFETKNALRLTQLKTLSDTRTRMFYIVNHLMDGVKSQKEIFEKYLVYRMKQILSFEGKEEEESGIAELILAIIEWGRQEGDIRYDLPLSMIADFFQFVFLEVAKQYYTNMEGFNQAEIVEASVDIFMNGVRPAIK